MLLHNAYQCILQNDLAFVNSLAQNIQLFRKISLWNILKFSQRLACFRSENKCGSKLSGLLTEKQGLGGTQQ